LFFSLITAGQVVALLRRALEIFIDQKGKKVQEVATQRGGRG
jgi:hypothetical protein